MFIAKLDTFKSFFEDVESTLRTGYYHSLDLSPEYAKLKAPTE